MPRDLTVRLGFSNTTKGCEGEFPSLCKESRQLEPSYALPMQRTLRESLILAVARACCAPLLVLRLPSHGG